MRYFPEPGTTLRGRRGGAYVLGAVIGSGGQGTVWEDSTGTWAIKLYGRASPDRQAKRRRRLEQVVARRVDSDALVAPTELLADPWVGYAMPLVRGYKPLKALIYPDDDCDPLDHYHMTGGPRVRLAALERLAIAFHAIHTAGLAYGDLSLDNVLVRESGPPEIRLIDCDNLVVSGSELAEVEGTPWFVAPEVLRRRDAPSERTDAHALAVLIQLTLSMRHPLLGDAVTDGPPEGEDRALRGELPWVDDPNDRSNRSSAGLPGALAWTTGVESALSRAFGAGRLDPMSRPTDLAWHELLATARDSLIRCKGGGCAREFTLRRVCPYCGAKRPQIPYLVFHRVGLDGFEEQRPLVLNAPTGLRERHLRHGRSTAAGILVEATPRLDGVVVLVNRSVEPLYLQASGSSWRPVEPNGRAEMSRLERLRLGADGVIAELRR